MAELSATPSQAARAAPTTVENIASIVRIEENATSRRSLSSRIGDAIGTFAGTLLFVGLHLLWFAVWVTWNLRLIPGLAPFDPFPFQLLALLVSLEGVLLTTFVLIKQNLMSQMADRRSHLDLQVNLLTEKEVTRLIQILQQVSDKLGIGAQVNDAETRELGQVTAVDELAGELDEQLPKGS